MRGRRLKMSQSRRTERYAHERRDKVDDLKSFPRSQVARDSPLLRLALAPSRVGSKSRYRPEPGSRLFRVDRQPFVHDASATLRNALTSAPSSFPSMPQRIW